MARGTSEGTRTGQFSWSPLCNCFMRERAHVSLRRDDWPVSLPIETWNAGEAIIADLINTGQIDETAADTLRKELYKRSLGADDGEGGPELSSESIGIIIIAPIGWSISLGALTARFRDS